MVKNDERIDEENVYIIGHSLGGMLAPRIDTQGGEFDGIVVLAGSARALWEISYDQNQDLLDMGLVDEDQEEELQELIEEEYKKALRIDEITVEEAKEMTVFGFSGYYLKEMAEYNTESLVENLQKPILVLQGEEDFQVTYEKDFSVFENLLRDKENATLISYEYLNHLFMKSQGPDKGTIQEYHQPGEVSEEVIEDIGNWILESRN